jgi:nucleotide-binding universal stress UspA family protein
VGEQTWPAIPPTRILFATDLSGRGDRAMDRAVQLAGTWGSELVAVHAFERNASQWPDYAGLPSWRRPPDIATLIESQLREDLGETGPLRVHLEEGPAIRVILDAIEREKCDLAVIGAGRHRTFGGIGATTSELFRASPVSFLVVKQRPRGAYARLLVGTDFTDEARRGLEIAAQLFPTAAVALIHAFDMPYKSMFADNKLSRDFGEMERETIATFLKEADLPQPFRERVTAFIEHGPPATMLHRYALEHRTDLTVIGAYERSRLFHSMIGGEGPRIIEAVPSDILVVRAERAQASPAQ